MASPPSFFSGSCLRLVQTPAQDNDLLVFKAQGFIEIDDGSVFAADHELHLGHCPFSQPQAGRIHQGPAQAIACLRGSTAT